MLADLDDRLPVGHVVAGRYRVVRVLGEGGMGTVYEASHVELGNAVALKVLAPAFSRDREMVGRFMREARAAAQIGHPGIVRVFDLGTDGRLLFLAMEKLEGEELQKRIQRAHPLPVAFVCRLGADLCDAVAAAHERGIVHRDLKPQNIFLAREGRQDDVVKVLDFGIAKLMENGPGDARTETGQVFGTPLYMAPEQLRDSKEVDPRTDVYAIGCVLYQALTGQPPFQSAAYPDLILKICSEPPPPVSTGRPDSGPSLSAIIARALSKNPKDRHASAAELRDDLAALIAPTERAPKGVGNSDRHEARPDAHAETQPSGSSAAATPAGQLAESGALSAHARTLKPRRNLRAPLVVAGTLAGLGAVAVWRLASSESDAAPSSSPAPGLAPEPPPTTAPVASVTVPPTATASIALLDASAAPSAVSSAAPPVTGPRPTSVRSKRPPPPPPPARTEQGREPPPLVPR